MPAIKKLFINNKKNILEAELFKTESNEQKVALLLTHPHPAYGGNMYNNVVSAVFDKFMDKGITLELTCDDDISVSADPDKLSQIIINLLSNALKATERGGSIWIKAATREAEVRIEIGDSGCGIREADLPFIFERFYRVSKGGLGIGLTIVKELTEAHGGEIIVDSAYGKGSLFTLILPS